MSSNKQRNRSRRTLLIVAGVFILPLIAAKLVLSLHWYETGVTNKGNLLDPPLTITAPDNEVLPNNWRIGVLVPERCVASCEHGLYVINQSYHALGRLQERVSAIGIQATTTHIESLPLPESSRIQIVSLPHAYQTISTLPAGSIFIMDPVGNIMLWYEGSNNRDEMIMQARNLLSDLKKMLKLSRVG